MMRKDNWFVEIKYINSGIEFADRFYAKNKTAEDISEYVRKNYHPELLLEVNTYPLSQMQEMQN